MSDATDMDLVREFAERNSELAFAELVRRHINLVYSVAQRFTGDGADAEDITQAVFVILAKKAATLRARAVLTGWIYETTRLAALQFLRNRARHHLHEQEAHMQTMLENQTAGETWSQLAPLLEDAMTRLSEKDRTLLALRYFENRTCEESAALLGIGEWAARKRSARALERLRNHFSRRGVNSTTEIIAGAISANSLQVAPAGLATSVTAVALAKGAAASASTFTLIQGALKLMAWTKTKTAILIGAAAMFTAGVTTVAVVKHQRATGLKNQSNPMGTNPGDFAPSKLAAMAHMKTIQMTVIPAFIQYAQEHDDDIPASMADLRPYLPPDTNGINYENWEILATGKLTPQLSQKNIILLQQKEVPDGQYARLKMIGYTDGHFTAKN